MSDTITGSAGEDTLTGTANAETIDGGNGDDLISGGGGDDLIYGGTVGTPASGTTLPANSSYVMVLDGGGAGLSTSTVYNIQEYTYVTATNSTPGIGSVLTFADGSTATISDISTYDTSEITHADGSTETTPRMGYIELSDGRVLLTATSANDNTFENTSTGGVDSISPSTVYKSHYTQWWVNSFTGFDPDTTVISTDGGDDLIDGGDGNDTIDGGGGADTIYGGAGDDLISNTDGNGGADNDADSIDAGTGNDTIMSSFGNDTIDGGDGIDTFDSHERGQDQTINLATGTVTMAGTTVSQTLSNIENVYGGHGSDSITGSDADNFLHGEESDDTIDGGAGNDTLEGGIGNDSILGGDGTDSILGGDGNDWILTNERNATNDTVYGGTGDDTISTSAYGGYQKLYGEDGNDSITGGNLAQYIDGGSGNDTLNGGEDGGTADTDTLIGGAGDDLIQSGFSGTGTTYRGDSLDGGAGNDTIEGGTSDDTIDGGAGNDTVDGGDGNDLIYGDKEVATMTSATTVFGDTNSGGTTTTITIDGIPFVVTTQYATDGLVIVSKVNPDGTLTETDRMTHVTSTNVTTTTSGGDISAEVTAAGFTAGNLGSGLHQSNIFDVDGQPTLFLTSQNAKAISTWEISADGTLSLKGGNPAISVDDGIIRENAVYEGADGTEYVYVTRGLVDRIDKLQYDPSTGNLTETGTTYPSGDVVTGIDVVKTSYGDFLTAGSGSNVQLYSIDASTGDLTLLDTETPDTTTNPGSSEFYQTADGKAYVFYTIRSTGDAYLYEVTATGLTLTDTLTGTGSTYISSSGEVEGNPVITIPNATQGVDLYTIGEDGTFEFVENYPDIQNDHMPPVVVQTADGTYHLVDADGTTSTTPITSPRLLSGDDSLFGGAGNDTIEGGEGNDSLDGGVGDDRLYGNAGNDSLDGGAGDDRLYGGDGSDTLNGGDGVDRLYGNAGDDVLSGGAGDDYLRGGDGNDSFTGGDGNDAYRIYETAGQGSGHDTITDFGAGNTGAIDDGDRLNNDNINLADFYSKANYDKAVAEGHIDPAVIKNPLQWLRQDQQDGVLNDSYAGWDAENTLTIQNAGSAVDGAALTTDTTAVMCFMAGTQILTLKGPVAVEDLCQGDMVLTRDNGYQAIVWIGQRRLSPAELRQNDNLRPIRIRAGALGAQIPSQDLIVSPQHRILVKSKIAQRLFDQDEVLVPAKGLLDASGIERIVEDQPVEYYHFLFEQHEIVWSNGAATESLYTGPEALKTLSAEARREIFTLFPELGEMRYQPRACRPLISRYMMQELLQRHVKNGKYFQ